MSESQSPTCRSPDTVNAHLDDKRAAELKKIVTQYSAEINQNYQNAHKEFIVDYNKGIRELFGEYQDQKNAEVTDLKEKLKKSETNRRNDQQKLRDSLEKNRQLEHELAQGEDY